ncbi:MAG: glycoside hydrolase family 127 protein [Clostridia bacterium]|nr:glycoside hydrolase family 127 protein [Clostridia bacterium]
MDAMKYLNLTQKYEGQINRAVSFLTENQLLDREMWKRFVDQFRYPIDGTNNGWRGEYWGKMMRAGALVYEYSRDRELYAVLEETVRDMLSVIGTHGKVSSFTEETQFRAWDMWCRKYVMLGLEYFYDVADETWLKQDIVSALCRVADQIICRIGDGEGQIPINEASNHWLGLNSSSILEPMVRLFRLSGSMKYFNFCKYIVESGGAKGLNIFDRAYENILKPYQYGVAKAYEMMSCFEGLLEFYRISENEKYKTAVINFAKSIIETEVSVIGSCGCTHELFDHTKTRQTQFYDGIMQETCVTVTWMKLCSQLLRLTGESIFADEMERSFYNAYLGSLNINMIASIDSEYIEKRYKKEFGEGEPTLIALPFDSYSPLIPGSRGRKIGGFQFMADKSYYGCCVCIGAAGVGVVAKHAVMQSADAVTVNFYEAGETLIETDEGKITLVTETDYPADGKIKLKISSACNFRLRLRVPEWSKKTKIPDNSRIFEGYAEMEISAGEREVEIELDMSIRETLPEKWDMDVLYINTCGRMRPPVPVRHNDEDDRFISLSRGPLTLAADSRLGKDAKSDFTFARKKGKIECETQIGSKIGNDPCMIKCRFEDEDGREFFLIDYASAGKDMASDIAAWLPHAE